MSSGPSDRISLGGQRRWAWLNKFSGGKSGYNNNGLGANGARIFEIGFSKNGMGPGKATYNTGRCGEAGCGQRFLASGGLRLTDRKGRE